MSEFKRGNLTKIPVNTGRRPAATNGKLSATRQKSSRANSLLAVTRVDALAPPDSIAPHQDRLELWHQTTRAYAAAGMLSDLDVFALEQFVLTVCSVRRVRAQLDLDGDTITNPRGAVYLNPLRTVLHSELSILRNLMSQLGLSPADRLKLQKLAAGAEIADDEAAAPEQRLIGAF